MSGAIALHGGGEFLPGDEPFLQMLLIVARQAAGEAEAVRVVVIPAAASDRPEMSAQQGTAAIEAVAAAAGIPARTEPALVVDAASAADPAIAQRIRAAHLIHLPGGDPGLVPTRLRGTAAWRSVLAAHERGAVLAGASAGAMALADRTWTSGGWRDGLGLVHGLVVVPHFEQFASEVRRRAADVERLDREGVGRLGLDERTGVLRESPGRWRVVGPGAASWTPPGGGAPSVARAGELLEIPA